jgi:hypothetical protein
MLKGKSVNSFAFYLYLFLKEINVSRFADKSGTKGSYATQSCKLWGYLNSSVFLEGFYDTRD